MTRESLAHLVLRIGLAFAFLYPPYAALSDPTGWAAYFPHFLLTLPLSTPVLLHTFGVFEVTIALWLLSGWEIRTPAVIACVLLLLIIAFNVNQFEILFRDLAIATIALALAIWPRAESVPNPLP